MEKSFSDDIKKLSYDYYNRNLSFEDYRVQRDQLIDDMDREFNGASQSHQESE